ncbi:hypothetical protein BGZ51_004945 [Haplosporangium sp. Z 767]|nr:hypothetical protein BGZ51_004945 [Haplosporangium sp. Z 767]
MVQYFIHFQKTGVIGIVSVILSGLYTYAVGLILNFAIQYTKSTDLRLRIAGTDDLFCIIKELTVSSRRFLRTRTVILTMILFLTLAGKSISYIITSGIKAGIGIHYEQPEVLTTRLSDFSLIVPSRGNYSQVLSAVYNWQKGSEDKAVDFEILSNSAPGQIFEVKDYTTAYKAKYKTVVIPGAISILRHTFKFMDDENITCEPTSPDCSLKSLKSNLTASTRPSELLEAPLWLYYIDSAGNTIGFARTVPVVAATKEYLDSYLTERPITRIHGYTDLYGASIYATITTASFQTPLPRTSQALVDTAWKLIGSKNPLYPDIFAALNASAYTPPLVKTLPSNKATLVFNTPTPNFNNLTHINCVGHEGQPFNDDVIGSAKNMISCREYRITVMFNNGTKQKVWIPGPGEGKIDDPRINTDFLTMYNAVAPTSISLKKITQGNMAIDGLDAIDQSMPSFLKDIADRLYPLSAEYSAKVTPYSYIDGILVELWALVFIVVVVAFVVVLFVLDMIMNDAVSKASVTTLIEHSTAENEIPVKDDKRDWGVSEYPPWELVRQGSTYQVTLRGERVGLKTSETESCNTYRSYQ